MEGPEIPGASRLNKFRVVRKEQLCGDEAGSWVGPEDVRTKS